MAATTEERVEVKVVDCRKGKGLFAKCTIHKGETILEEKPLVCAQFAWNELYKYRACEFCLRSLETAEEMSRRLTNNPSVELPHPECCTVTPKEFVSCPQCQVEYCSAACQQKAWQAYHQTLCMGPSRQDPSHPLNKLLEIWRNMHYPPETATIMLLVKMIAMVKQTTDKDGVMAAFSQFVNATVNEEEQMAHKLLGKQFVENLALLRQGLMEAVFTEEVQQWFTPEGFQSLMALIGTNSQGIGTSSVSVWAKNCELLELPEEERQTLDSFIDQLYLDLEKVTGIQFLNCEGSGLYQMQSACNHSCQPNAEITFPYNDHTLVLVALEDILPEEEICISYLDECTLERSRHSRQAFLRENYLFTCDCKKCLEQADDPDVTSEEEMDEEDEDEEDEIEDGDMDEEEEALEALKD